MKVLMVPYTFYPDPVAGTEIYVESLAKTLIQKGHSIEVAAPGQENKTHTQRDLHVHRFAYTQPPTREQIYGGGDELAAKHFDQILEATKPDIVHLHAYSSANSTRLVEVAKQRGAKVVYTYHTPTASCARGALLYKGKQVCDGRLEARRCTDCVLHKLRVPWGLRHLLALPLPWVQGARNKTGKLWTALSMRGLIAQQQDAFRGLIAKVDHVVVLSDWVQALLRQNECPESKMTLSRQGLFEMVSLEKTVSSGETFRLAYMGRIHPDKGIEVLLQTLEQEPELTLQLDVIGVVEAGAEVYAQALQKRTQSDARIHWLSPVASEEVVATLQGYDALAVPSQIMETGPLVVLQAHAAGIPVIGADLGGIRERVRDGQDGWLVHPYNSITAWRKVLCQLILDPTKRQQVAIQAPRTMLTVAEEMEQVYQTLMV